MGNSHTQNPQTEQITSLAEYFPSPSPTLPSHAPFADDLELITESIVSIHDEMDEILNIISRILLNYIKIGQKKPQNQASAAFNERQYLKKKWMTKILSHQCDIMPFFSYEQVILHPETKFPNTSNITDFIKPIFDKLGIQNECLLMMLIYIDRIMSEEDISLNKENWRPIVYSALILSGKMLEDMSIANVDYSIIYPFFSLNSTNFLEKQITSSLHWNLFISQEQYSAYLRKLKGMISVSDHSLLDRLSRQGSLREDVEPSF